MQRRTSLGNEEELLFGEEEHHGANGAPTDSDEEDDEQHGGAQEEEHEQGGPAAQQRPQQPSSAALAGRGTAAAARPPRPPGTGLRRPGADGSESADSSTLRAGTSLMAAMSPPVEIHAGAAAAAAANAQPPTAALAFGGGGMAFPAPPARPVAASMPARYGTHLMGTSAPIAIRSRWAPPAEAAAGGAAAGAAPAATTTATPAAAAPDGDRPATAGFRPHQLLAMEGGLVADFPGADDEAADAAEAAAAGGAAADGPAAAALAAGAFSVNRTERLRARNAILKSTGFLEPTAGGRPPGIAALSAGLDDAEAAAVAAAAAGRAAPMPFPTAAAPRRAGLPAVASSLPAGPLPPLPASVQASSLTAALTTIGEAA